MTSVAAIPAKPLIRYYDQIALLSISLLPSKSLVQSHDV